MFVCETRKQKRKKSCRGVWETNCWTFGSEFCREKQSVENSYPSGKHVACWVNSLRKKLTRGFLSFDRWTTSETYTSNAKNIENLNLSEKSPAKKVWFYTYFSAVSYSPFFAKWWRDLLYFILRSKKKKRHAKSKYIYRRNLCLKKKFEFLEIIT